jgi:hypothetical protein
MTTTLGFLCAGCAQDFEVGPPECADACFVCPLPECQRAIWHRFAQPDHTGRTALVLGTDDVPDLTAGSYVVDRCRLLRHGEEVLVGPNHVLRDFAQVLNADEPALIDVAARVRQLIQECAIRAIFVPGPVLVHSGTMAQIAKRQKP